VWPQGTLLWGTARKTAGDATSSVLASLDLGQVRLGGATRQDVHIEEGRLVAPSLSPEGLVGAMLQGTASDGQPVEVALCGAEPAAGEPAMVRYRIEVWNAASASWENPCIATGRVPAPRALAVQGVWDETGARHDEPGKFTFACENGAIAKCIDWGYKPWAVKGGRALKDLHQACTRMARADYCGNGRSHTREGNPIDMYDAFKVITRTTETSEGWVLARASFEAAWTPEGAHPRRASRRNDSGGVSRSLHGGHHRPQRRRPLHGAPRRCALRCGAAAQPLLRSGRASPPSEGSAVGLKLLRGWGSPALRAFALDEQVTSAGNRGSLSALAFKEWT
jgi:hypothetical protein